MLSYRLGTVNDFHWGFKPVLSYSKPHTFSTSLGEEKERKNAFNLSNHVRNRNAIITNIWRQMHRTNTSIIITSSKPMVNVILSLKK